MFTITVCPKCGKDFMYHRSDVPYLTIQTTLVDEVGVNEVVDMIICQNCREIKNQEERGANHKINLEI